MDNANSCEQKTPNVFERFRTHSGDTDLRLLDDAAIVRATEIQQATGSGIIVGQERSSR